MKQNCMGARFLVLLLAIVACLVDGCHAARLSAAVTRGIQLVRPEAADLYSLGRHASRSLKQNPDVPAIDQKYGGLLMEDMVIPNGYPLEKHRVMTNDGWALNLYRIPHGKNQQPGPRPVVLLHHGITLSSACFTVLRPNESMAYIFADAGYDVWMANTRSNTFSRGNLYYSYRDPEYWWHSIDEYALIDTPAQINKVLEVSGAKKLAFVGHSQGSSIIYATLSSMPEMNEKISVVIHMGPVVFIRYLAAPVVREMAEAGNDNFFAVMHMSEFLWYRMLAPYVSQCNNTAVDVNCMRILNDLLFGSSKFITPEDFGAILQTWPASVSSRNLHQWAEMLRTDSLVFQKYDYGTNCADRSWFSETCNQEKFNSLTPPEYDLGVITAPQAILQGGVDVLSTANDIAEQQRRLAPGVLVQTIKYNEYSHMDFIWDRNAVHVPDMLKILKKFSPGTF